MANDAAACLSINLLLETLEDMAITSSPRTPTKVLAITVAKLEEQCIPQMDYFCNTYAYWDDTTDPIHPRA
jgi:hypothetical protein